MTISIFLSRAFCKKSVVIWLPWLSTKSSLQFLLALAAVFVSKSSCNHLLPISSDVYPLGELEKKQSYSSGLKSLSQESWIAPASEDVGRPAQHARHIPSRADDQASDVQEVHVTHAENRRVCAWSTDG
jgi:hypothetical protein